MGKPQGARRMSEGENGFLSRWSRLKREQPAPAPQADPAPATPEPAPILPPPTLTDEEIAALPKLEELVEGSDIRMFLRSGVPAALKNAALRKMWMLTPAIRDYRDPAVDYAWDWNTPGGVPGDGCAPSPERAAEMLKGLLKADRETPETVVADNSDDSADDGKISLVVQSENAAEQQSTCSASAPESEKIDILNQYNSENAAPRRRHGGALPS
jgi:hypothetical protein